MTRKAEFGMVAFVVVVACLVATACYARSRVWEAEVRQVGNSPCFATDRAAGTNEVIEIGALSVFEVKPGGHEVWALASQARDSLVLVAGKCIEYADKVPGTLDIVAPHSLSTNTAYGITMNASFRLRNKKESRKYRAFFCLIDSSAGAVVHQVTWSENERRWRWDECGASAAP